MESFIKEAELKKKPIIDIFLDFAFMDSADAVDEQLQYNVKTFYDLNPFLGLCINKMLCKRCRTKKKIVFIEILI